MLAAKQPLVVPMLLRLSNFKLNSYVVLVISKQKGITIVFKTDPLQNVDINSTFDSIAVIQKFIQREIEDQLRQMFREDLPSIIHRLSQQWMKAKVEAPYLHRKSGAHAPVPTALSSPDLHRHSTPSQMRSTTSTLSGHAHSAPFAPLDHHPSSNHDGEAPPPNPISSSPSSLPKISDASFPDIENFDPTYGLRPEGAPSRAAFGNLKRLFGSKKGGLADLAQLQEEMTQEPDESVQAWEHLSEFGSTTRGSDEMTEYESLPAVGGGVITRPRVIHGQSPALSPAVSMRTVPLSSLPSSPSWGSPSAYHQQASSSRTSPMIAGVPRLGPRSMSSVSNPYFPRMQASLAESIDGDDATEMSNVWPTAWSQQGAHRHQPPPRPPTPPLYQPSSRTLSPSSADPTSGSSQSLMTPPLSEHADGLEMHTKRRPRRISLSSSDFEGFQAGSPPEHHYLSDAGSRHIIVRPTLSNPVSQLRALSHSNHTLSPFTRNFQHFAVRSGPRKTGTTDASVPERVPVKAKRRRTHLLGAKPLPTSQENHGLEAAIATPVGGEEFDSSEMDRYFPVHDDRPPPYAESSHSRSRPRHNYHHLP